MDWPLDSQQEPSWELGSAREVPTVVSVEDRAGARPCLWTETRQRAMAVGVGRVYTDADEQQDPADRTVCDLVLDLANVHEHWF